MYDPENKDDLSPKDMVVKALIEHYIPAKNIAKYIGMKEIDFRLAYQDFFQDTDYAFDEIEAVEQAMFRTAIEGNATCLVSWLKNKAGWDDGKSKSEEVAKDITIPKVVFELLTPAKVEQMKKEASGEDTEEHERRE